MYKNFAEEILDALAECKGVASVCRGWPGSFELLPCIAVSEASNEVAVKYGDTAYAEEAEYYVRIFTKKATEGDSIAVEVQKILEALDFERTFTYEDDNENVRQRLMRFSKIY